MILIDDDLHKQLEPTFQQISKDYEAGLKVTNNNQSLYKTHHLLLDQKVWQVVIIQIYTKSAIGKGVIEMDNRWTSSPSGNKPMLLKMNITIS